MRKPGLAAVGFGLIGIGSSFVASPASAAIDCGTAPTGGTLTQAGDYCQVVFETPGDYSLTVPTSSNQLFALVVGAGSGVQGAAGDGEGYAGNAGRVVYKDLSSGIGQPIAVHVGYPGSNTDGSFVDGGDTNAVDANNNAAIAFGGVHGTSPDYFCTIPGFSGGVIANGTGARTTPATTGASTCSTRSGEGVRPILGDVDSNGLATPEIFRDLDAYLGFGGVASTSLPFITSPGSGGWIVVDNSGTDQLTAVSSPGAGIAYLRWRHVDAPVELAATGSNSFANSAFAGGLIALGTAVTVLARLRRRASK